MCTSTFCRSGVSIFGRRSLLTRYVGNKLNTTCRIRRGSTLPPTRSRQQSDLGFQPSTTSTTVTCSNCGRHPIMDQPPHQDDSICTVCLRATENKRSLGGVGGAQATTVQGMSSGELASTLDRTPPLWHKEVLRATSTRASENGKYACRNDAVVDRVSKFAQHPDRDCRTEHTVPTCQEMGSPLFLGTEGPGRSSMQYCAYESQHVGTDLGSYSSGATCGIAVSSSDSLSQGDASGGESCSGLQNSIQDTCPLGANVDGEASRPSGKLDHHENRNSAVKRARSSGPRIPAPSTSCPSSEPQLTSDCPLRQEGESLESCEGEGKLARFGCRNDVNLSVQVPPLPVR